MKLLSFFMLVQSKSVSTPNTNAPDCQLYPA